MQIIVGSAILLAIACFAVVHLHGYCNAVSWLALTLQRHAKRMQVMQSRRAAALREDWVKELES